MKLGQVEGFHAETAKRSLGAPSQVVQSVLVGIHVSLPPKLGGDEHILGAFTQELAYQFLAATSAIDVGCI